MRDGLRYEILAYVVSSSSKGARCFPLKNRPLPRTPKWGERTMMMMEGGGNCCCKAKEVGGSKSKRCVFVFLRSAGSCFGWGGGGPHIHVRSSTRTARRGGLVKTQRAIRSTLYSIYCRSVASNTHSLATAAAVHVLHIGRVKRARHTYLEK